MDKTFLYTINYIIQIYFYGVEGKLARGLPDDKWWPLPMNICNVEITNTLPAFKVRFFGGRERKGEERGPAPSLSGLNTKVFLPLHFNFTLIFCDNLKLIRFGPTHSTAALRGSTIENLSLNDLA